MQVKLTTNQCSGITRGSRYKSINVDDDDFNNNNNNINNHNNNNNDNDNNDKETVKEKLQKIGFKEEFGTL